MAANTVETVGAVSQAKAAEMTGLSLSTNKSLTRSGALASLLVGRRRLITYRAIATFLAEREARH